MKTGITRSGLKRRGVTIAIAAVMVLSVFGFAPQMGAGDAHAYVETYSLTLHWSSVDGDDIPGQEPIVIQRIMPGTTIEDALATESIRLFDEHFSKDGYVDSGNRNYRSMSEYNDWLQIEATNLDDARAEIRKNTHIYCYMSKALNEANLTVKAPICGSKITTGKDKDGDWDLSTQTNKPQVTIPKNANYGAINMDMIPLGFWGTLDMNVGRIEPCQTTFKGGNSYPVAFIVLPKLGYQFVQNAKFTLDGGSVTKIEHVGGLFIANGQVKAIHNWDGGRVTKQATATATGKRTYTCNVCHATKTEAINRLPKKANTLKVNGKTVKIKYKKLKKKNQVVGRAKAMVISNPQGKVTYKKNTVTYIKAKSVKVSKKELKKYKKQAAKKIVINGTTGNVIVKKGLKKGTYKVNVKVAAAGNAGYKPVTKNVTISITVR